MIYGPAPSFPIVLQACQIHIIVHLVKVCMYMKSKCCCVLLLITNRLSVVISLACETTRLYPDSITITTFDHSLV